MWSVSTDRIYRFYRSTILISYRNKQCIFCQGGIIIHHFALRKTIIILVMIQWYAWYLHQPIRVRAGPQWTTGYAIHTRPWRQWCDVSWERSFAPEMWNIYQRGVSHVRREHNTCRYVQGGLADGNMCSISFVSRPKICIQENNTALKTC